MKKYICQINNLKIYQIAEVHYRYAYFSPDGRKLEEFRYLEDCKLSAKNTKDFIKNK